MILELFLWWVLVRAEHADTLQNTVELSSSDGRGYVWGSFIASENDAALFCENVCIEVVKKPLHKTFLPVSMS